MSFDVPFLALIPGFNFGPTAELCGKYKKHVLHGLARATAPHLYVPARDETPELWIPSVYEGAATLDGFVGRDSSPIPALGMAYAQLDRASEVNWRIFVANMDANDLSMASVAPGETFYDPRLVPVESQGVRGTIDLCLSVPGLASWVEYWQTVIVSAINRPESREVDDVAAILQHENNHLNGWLCIQMRVPGTPVYFVPPELKALFFQYVDAGRLAEWPYQILGDDWYGVLEFLDVYVMENWDYIVVV